MRSRCRQKGGSQEPADHALGRSRGGFGTKIHLVTDGRGLRLAVVISAGQRHESKLFLPAFEATRLPRTKARAYYRPHRLAGDRAYSTVWIRSWLRHHRIETVIPYPARQHALAERDDFDADTYRGRNVIERCICWLKECRRVFSRYDKLAVSYLAFLKLAIMQRLLRLDFSNEP